MAIRSKLTSMVSAIARIQIVARENSQQVRIGSIRHHTVADWSTGIPLKVKKSKQSNPKLPSTISQLKSRWKRLSSVDRARAVAKIRRAHISIRQIGRELGRSESGLRYLLKTHKAPPKKRDLAQHNGISTEEPSRRGPVAEIRPAEPPAVAVEAPRVQSAGEGADLICDWILSKDLQVPDRVRIIKDVRNERLAIYRSRPALPDHAALPITELIKRYKPKTLLGNNFASLTEYTNWLDRWSFFAFKDPTDRDGALEQALKRLKEK